MRKALLTALVVTFVLLIFSCSGSDEAKPLNEKLEILHWWTVEGEADGLEALFERYEQKHPNVEITNSTIAGGTGTNARSVMSARVKSGNPPDSMQALAGEAMLSRWIKPGHLEPLTKIYTESSLKGSIRKNVLDNISYQGEVYAIPLNVHRSNVLWYNIDLFERYHLQAPKTIDELLEVCEIFAANGVTPLAVGDKNLWTSVHLFENVILARLGPEKYSQLWKGEASFLSPEFEEAIGTFVKLLDFVNSDHGALSWDQASEYMLEGICAMTNVGDWTEGLFRSIGLELGEDYGYVVFPDTQGTFCWLSDTFVLPKNAPHRQAALDWLKLCASVEGQDLFNPKKGSIPARIDTDQSLYPEYLQYTMEDFAEDTLVGSVTHLVAVEEEWLNSLLNVVNLLIVRRNVSEAQNAMHRLQQKYCLRR